MNVCVCSDQPGILAQLDQRNFCVLSRQDFGPLLPWRQHIPSPFIYHTQLAPGHPPPPSIIFLSTYLSYIHTHIHIHTRSSHFPPSTPHPLPDTCTAQTCSGFSSLSLSPPQASVPATPTLQSSNLLVRTASTSISSSPSHSSATIWAALSMGSVNYLHSRGATSPL